VALSTMKITVADIVLRPWEMDDAGAFHLACQDDEIPRWTGFPYRMSAEEAANLVAARIASPDSSSTAFAVVDRADCLLGSVSLLWIDCEKSVGEVAYWLSADSRGKGIGRKAVAALCDWAFDTLGLQRLQLTVDIRNQPSWRLAERVGFQREGLMRSSRVIHGEPIDEYLYSLLPLDRPFANPS